MVTQDARSEPSNDSSVIEEKIKHFALQSLIRDPDIDLASDEPIFSAGLLDSFAVIQLMRFLEDEFKIVINVSDVTIEDFDTLGKIRVLVERLRARNG